MRRLNLNGHRFEQTPRDGGGQRSLVCYSPWGHKESDTTERLNNKNQSSWERRCLFTSYHLFSFGLIHFIYQLSKFEYIMVFSFWIEYP